MSSSSAIDEPASRWHPFDGSSTDMVALVARLREEGLFRLNHRNAFCTNPPLCLTEEEPRNGFTSINRALGVADSAVS